MVGIRSSIVDRRGGFMLEIVAVTDKYKANPPNPSSRDRLLLKSGMCYGYSIVVE
jgi:hypothetical protein